MNKRFHKAISLETFVFLLVVLLLFTYMGAVMGVGNLFNTMMNTAHDLLLNTVLFIMGIAVIAGALSALLSEFGVIALFNRLLSPIMRPLYGLPGAAALGVITTFLSDNPAIIPLARDKGFSAYFKRHELIALCNLGTAFGMGLIVWTYMGAQQIGGKSNFTAASVGLLGAVIGSIVSVRIMMHFSRNYFAEQSLPSAATAEASGADCTASESRLGLREIRQGSVFQRILEAALDGGKAGVEMGVQIIPGVLIICTLVMLLTMDAPVNEEGIRVFSGAAYEGVALLPRLGGYLSFLFKPVLGFSHAEALVFPMTALGSVGAALGTVPKLIQSALIGPHEIAVFTSLGMCWSGYLSTHVAMMDALHCRELTNKAILSHTIGGFLGGVSAHLLMSLLDLIRGAV